eukprot:182197_1
MSLNGVGHVITNVNSETVIAFVVIACLSCVVCLPIMLYWSYKMYNFRHQSFVRSHHPKILFFNCGLACICVIERVIALAHDLRIFQYDTVIRNVVYIFIFGLYIHSYLLRHWLLFYDLGYREAQVNIRWEHQLNLVRSHWFIDHRLNLGNATFMICFLFIFFHVMLAVLFALYLIYGELVWRISISVCGVVLALIFIFISYKITTIHDAKMKREVLYAGIILLVGSLLYSIIISMIHLAQTTIIIISWFVSTLLPFVLHLISTWYQVKSNTAQRKRSLAQQRQMDALFDRLPAKKLTLREILKNADGFKLFIRHLIKDLCVENLIYLSYVIQFKILYSFLVQKELDSVKTRAALPEEDESFGSQDDDAETRTSQHKSSPRVVRVKTYSNALSPSSISGRKLDYFFDDDEEYNELYGWSMELPQVFGLQDKDKIKSTSAFTNEEILTVSMYQEALTIYTRFIKVASKDEINISGKMRKELKKYFENEEITSYPQPKTAISIPRFMAKVSTSKDRSLSGAAQLPGSIPAAKGSFNYSNESMNIHLTQDSNQSIEANESIDLDSSDAISTEMSDVMGDMDVGMGFNKEEKREKRTRGSTIGSEFGTILKKSFAGRKAPKLRSVVAEQPTDRYLNLTWIQRFHIFDKSCDSIEKLLRIDSFGKFRESPEYMTYCEILSKKRTSTANVTAKLARQTSDLMKSAMGHAKARSSDIKGSIQTALSGTSASSTNGNALR